eukprot:7191030-Prymnesium_polylepis.1
MRPREWRATPACIRRRRERGAHSRPAAWALVPRPADCLGRFLLGCGALRTAGDDDARGDRCGRDGHPRARVGRAALVAHVGGHFRQRQRRRRGHRHRRHAAARHA